MKLSYASNKILVGVVGSCERGLQDSILHKDVLPVCTSSLFLHHPKAQPGCGLGEVRLARWRLQHWLYSGRSGSVFSYPFISYSWYRLAVNPATGMDLSYVANTVKFSAEMWRNTILEIFSCLHVAKAFCNNKRSVHKLFPLWTSCTCSPVCLCSISTLITSKY